MPKWWGDKGVAPAQPSGKAQILQRAVLSGPRTILHIDMDAFFAAVEIRDNPALAHLPVAVGGGDGNRGIVTSANYIARGYGLKAGMTALEARRLCPQVVFLPVNGKKYTFVSAQIMAALERFSPDVRPLSVDEASLDITGMERLFKGPLDLGRRLKAMVRYRFGLPCTVGIGPNRLVAKMAANLAKPDGLMLIESDNVAEVFAPLPVSELVGVGAATTRALNSIGIRTLGELAAAPDWLLKIKFGIFGGYLKAMAAGQWAGRMRQDDERGGVEHSIGHQRTFDEPLDDVARLRERMVGLVEMVARRARRGGVVGRVLTITVRYTDFHTPTHQVRMPVATDDEETLIDTAWRLLDECWQRGRPLRLLGVSLSELSPKRERGGQLELFHTRRRRKLEALHPALDKLRDIYGERIIARALGGRFAPRRSTRELPPDMIRARAAATG